MPYFYRMHKVDYIVVGLGLAGIAFCEQLKSHDKSFVVIDNARLGASRVSGGMINPVVLKRYTLAWRAEEQMDLMPGYYGGLSKKLKTEIFKHIPVLRAFASIEDQNNWCSASGNKNLERFMEGEIIKNPEMNVAAPYHFGKVRETAWVNVPLLLDSYKDYLQNSGQFMLEQFEHDRISFQDDDVSYKNIRARHIVFAEGYGIKNNRFFKNVPLVGNKGEYIIIKAEDLKFDEAIKSHFFIIPLGNSLYKVGATFNWKDKNTDPSEDARREILEKLKKTITCPFQVVGQEAGVRPTTGDRRPLLGKHPHYPQLVLFNGLGTRGILMSPYLAQLLYHHLEKDIKLPHEVDISRFSKKSQFKI